MFGKTKWYLTLYPPKGAHAISSFDHASCFLCKKDESQENISFSCILEAIDSEGQILQSYKALSVKGYPKTGCYSFLQRKNLPNLETNDNLTIRCHLIKNEYIEQIVKCEARTEIPMEKISFKWKVQLPDIPECSKEISTLFQSSTQFNALSTTSDDEIHLKVIKVSSSEVAELPDKIYKLEISVFDDKCEKLELQNGIHFFKPENGYSEFSTSFDKKTLQTNDSSYLSFVVKFDISSPIAGKLLSTIESYDFENILEETYLAKVRPTFQDNLRDMLLKEKYCDVKLRTGDKVVPAHKSVLSVRSPVFAAMFDSDMAESHTGIVDILEIEHDVLLSFLEFLYTDTLRNTDCEHLLKLILVADRYQVQSLKERCSPILLSKLSVENAVQVIHVADLINNENLKMLALEYIKANKSKIINSHQWSEWVEKNTKLAIQILSKLSIN